MVAMSVCAACCWMRFAVQARARIAWTVDVVGCKLVRRLTHWIAIATDICSIRGWAPGPVEYQAMDDSDDFTN